MQSAINILHTCFTAVDYDIRSVLMDDNADLERYVVDALQVLLRNMKDNIPCFVRQIEAEVLRSILEKATMLLRKEPPTTPEVLQFVANALQIIRKMRLERELHSTQVIQLILKILSLNHSLQAFADINFTRCYNRARADALTHSLRHFLNSTLMAEEGLVIILCLSRAYSENIIQRTAELRILQSALETLPRHKEELTRLLPPLTDAIDTSKGVISWCLEMVEKHAVLATAGHSKPIRSIESASNEILLVISLELLDQDASNVTSNLLKRGLSALSRLYRSPFMWRKLPEDVCLLFNILLSFPASKILPIIKPVTRGEALHNKELLSTLDGVFNGVVERLQGFRKSFNEQKDAKRPNSVAATSSPLCPRDLKRIDRNYSAQTGCKRWQGEYEDLLDFFQNGLGDLTSRLQSVLLRHRIQEAKLGRLYQMTDAFSKNLCAFLDLSITISPTNFPIPKPPDGTLPYARRPVIKAIQGRVQRVAHTLLPPISKADMVRCPPPAE
ncbi:hypothetical protein HDU67_005815 [Dinochytrium kinnereticum]|nr:hypothetical protein HDU67_005815 [Dinochytrium kinnereticum]